MTAVAFSFGPKNLSRIRVQTQWLVDRQQVRSIDRNLFSSKIKFLFFETTTMNEVNRDKTKVPD